MATFFDTRKRKAELISIQGKMWYFTIHVILTIQVWMAMLLSVNFTGVIIVVGVAFAISTIPLLALVSYYARKEQQSLLEYINYALNTKRY